MKLTINITAPDISWDRRVINNLLAHSEREIHRFILNAPAHELDIEQNMGNRNYNLQIKLEDR